MFHDFWQYDAMGLAELIHRREVSAEEVVEAAVETCNRLNPILNAVRYDASSFACRQMEKPAGGAFSGVPFLLKDIGAQLQGTPYEAGSRLLAGYRSSFDSTLTRRFLREGLVLIGKSTTPEFGFQITTEPRVGGVTRNPWNLRITAGGSSGGAAAAVAAGIVPVAHATDALGSIRIPAANCGVFGLKPTRQRTPTGPRSGELSQGRTVEFVISRSVRDSAAMLDAVHGADPGAPYSAPTPSASFLQGLATKSRALRIAVMTRTFSGARVHPACERAVHALSGLCGQLHHQVEEVAPEIDWTLYRRGLRIAATVSLAASVAAYGRLMKRTPSEAELEPLTWRAVCEAKQHSALDYYSALDAFATCQRQVGAFFESYDVLLTPMLSQPPADLGWLGVPETDLDAFWERFAGDAYSPFAGIFNVTGQPAASIPCGRTDDNRPLGCQIVARFGDEQTLLKLAAQIEEARPWSAVLPPVHARVPATGLPPGM